METADFPKMKMREQSPVPLNNSLRQHSGMFQKIEQR